MCDFKAASTTYLNTHKKVKHFGIRFPCPSCDFSGTTLSNLKAHTNKVHEELNLACDQCNYRTYSQLKLNNHKVKKHAPGMPPCKKGTYQCPECDYAGIKLAHLKQHLIRKHQISFDENGSNDSNGSMETGLEVGLLVFVTCRDPLGPLVRILFLK